MAEMAGGANHKRVCSNGHQYATNTVTKNTVTPECPLCKKQQQLQEELFSSLSAPARRALENKGIHTIIQLATFSEAELLKLHGMGPASLPLLRRAVKKAGLVFKK